MEARSVIQIGTDCTIRAGSGLIISRATSHYVFITTHMTDQEYNYLPTVVATDAYTGEPCDPAVLDRASRVRDKMVVKGNRSDEENSSVYLGAILGFLYRDAAVTREMTDEELIQHVYFFLVLKKFRLLNQ